MNLGIRHLLFAAVCTALAGLALRGSPTTSRTAQAAPLSSPQPVSLPAVVPPTTKGRFMGAGSCTASACHGNVISREPGETESLAWKKGGEYSIWFKTDRHAIAYATLLTRRSKEIAKKLELKNPAHKEALCLKCHSLTADTDAIVPGRHAVLDDGVSCEACHGAAEHWLETHKRHRFPESQRDFDWRSLTGEQKAAWGFTATDSLLGRANACVRCHVGSSDADVNHDLIAAGHPRLYFELSTYLAKLPPHWDVARERQQHPALDAKLWTVGRLAAADASLELLAHRATLQPPAPWPEFAEYGCFACHHELSGTSWRQNLSSSHKPGRYQWGTWNFAFIDAIVRMHEGEAQAAQLKSDLDDLKKLMAEPFPPQDTVKQKSESLRARFQELARAAEQGQYGDDDLQALMAYLAQNTIPEAMNDWDTSAQLCVALTAIARSRQPASSPSGYAPVNPAAFDELQGIRNLLRFPAAERLRFSSPPDFGNKPQADDLESRWTRLRQIIEAK